MSQRIQIDKSHVDSDNLPVFYKYRFTYPDNMAQTEHIAMANRIASEIRHLYCKHDARMVIGIEYFTKGMVHAKPHVHIHFVSKTNSDTIRKHLARTFEMVGRCQSCKAEILVDEDKFWRYPLKQQKNDTKVYYRQFGFDDECQNMVDVAYACWKQSAEVAIRKEEARLERTSKDRLFVYLDTQTITTLREGMISAFRYYAEYEENFNPNTVKGYVYIYLMKKNIVSVETLVDMFI